MQWCGYFEVFSTQVPGTYSLSQLLPLHVYLSSNGHRKVAQIDVHTPGLHKHRVSVYTHTTHTHTHTHLLTHSLTLTHAQARTHSHTHAHAHTHENLHKHLVSAGLQREHLDQQCALVYLLHL